MRPPDIVWQLVERHFSPQRMQGAHGHGTKQQVKRGFVEKAAGHASRAQNKRSQEARFDPVQATGDQQHEQVDLEVGGALRELAGRQQAAG